MNQQLSQIKRRAMESRTRELSKPSLPGLMEVSHGSEITLSVKTPVGQLYQVSSVFIGTNGKDKLFIELPKVTKIEREQFFQLGYRVTIKAVSEKGEGALVNVRTKLSHIITDPVPLLVVDIPPQINVVQLRKEPRYNVSLEGKIVLPNRVVHVVLKDLSSSGCSFYLEANGPTIEINSHLAIEIVHPSTELMYPLSGKVCNHQLMGGNKQLGIEFDDLGQQAVRELMSKLIFDGAKLSFKK
ncbi:flagellar brake protein [Photobacterium sp. DNB23_23_1]|uniref:Flagellar brake protein n=1 Tax=Photobacterium pectinilyticum TaxID=2906793 RepID=A0ABT1N526_9GAMM|nr:PilZ domain-containing protein [Photobacterium sp. ZSDE20]MCQ1059855.1 flagellar brake protein [Photobacterium sp. ZSDE20]MDD1826448.1 flagellar brake protein [Photobacterium sp. ZSDE20]